MILYILVWLLNTALQSVSVVANILRIIGDFVVLLSGTFGIITAILLKTGQVIPGRYWGKSSLGAAFIGIGLIAFTALQYVPENVSFGLYLVLVVLSLLVLVGLVVEYRSRTLNRWNGQK